jgi:hypothetical protein
MRVIKRRVSVWDGWAELDRFVKFQYDVAMDLGMAK